MVASGQKYSNPIFGYSQLACLESSPSKALQISFKRWQTAVVSQSLSDVATNLYILGFEPLLP